MMILLLSKLESHGQLPITSLQQTDEDLNVDALIGFRKVHRARRCTQMDYGLAAKLIPDPCCP